MSVGRSLGIATRRRQNIGKRYSDSLDVNSLKGKRSAIYFHVFFSNIRRLVYRSSFLICLTTQASNSKCPNSFATSCA